MSDAIEILGARQHNLKNISVNIPKSKITVITGPSGSGKSSLAFNTLFAEGQRRFMESLSTYARQFLDQHERPDVDEIKWLSPTIAIEQKNQTKNARSTVGTATEIYDYLRLIFAKMGAMYCPKTGEPVKKDLVREIVATALSKHGDQLAMVSFPVESAAKSKVSDRKRLLATYLERGFTRAYLQSDLKVGHELTLYDLQEEIAQKSSVLLGKAGKPAQIGVIVDRFRVGEDDRARLSDSIAQSYGEGYGRCRIIFLNDDKQVQSVGRYTEYPSTGDGENRYPEMSPQLFSFNSPLGACETCKGFGNILRIDEALVVPNPNLSLSQGAIEPLSKPSCRDFLKKLLLFCQAEKISLNVSWKAMGEKDRKKIWSGTNKFIGLEGFFADLEKDRYKVQTRVFLSRYRSPRECPDCSGARLKIEARSVLFHGKTIGDLTKMTIEDLSKWFKGAALTKQEKEIGKDLFPQIEARLDFLLRVGLHYLSLSRLAKTLSGGEAQRIALANQLGSRLTQTCYVLDEPSIGLHPRDTERLISIMRDLAQLRNTVVVVEHDPDIIRSADHLIDIGPGAGELGGELIFSGAFKDFIKSPPERSTTGLYLTEKESVPVPMRRRMDRFKDKGRSVHWLEMTGCSEHNLKNVDLKIPVGMLTCITGVSGSGKSTAVRKTLYPALAKILLAEIDEIGKFEKITGFEGIKSVLLVDQEPIGRSPRSNPVTYMKTYDEIRQIFARTMDARKKHFHAGHFSFNVPGGRCEVCEGEGYTRVEMVFMEDIFVLCDTCEGKRFKKEILDIEHNGKNIHQVLQMTVSEAKRFFAGENRLSHNLNVLESVGLGYLRLGQASNTLSGGESQRLKIARELASQDTAGMIYILDEPTTGLHFRDVKVLLRVLHELVERGNTVVVIEHNVDVMKSSDWMIDFGPDGGDEGGRIVAQGTPEDIVRMKKGHTAKFLAEVLARSPKVSVPDLLATGVS